MQQKSGRQRGARGTRRQGIKGGEDVTESSTDSVESDNVLSPAEIQLLLASARPGRADVADDQVMNV